MYIRESCEMFNSAVMKLCLTGLGNVPAQGAHPLECMSLCASSRVCEPFEEVKNFLWVWFKIARWLQ